MALGWYLTVSALVFCLGIGFLNGYLVMRTGIPSFLITLGTFFVLQGGNLALVAFSRGHGSADGQIFALIVMVVAACEVVVGLGLIVAIHRRRLPVDVDELSELRG